MICGYLAIWICCQTFCVVGVLRCCIFSGLWSSTILWIAVNSVYGRKQAKKFLLTPKRFERGKGFCLRKHYQLPQHTHAVPHKTCNHFWRSLWAYKPCNRKKLLCRFHIISRKHSYWTDLVLRQQHLVAVDTILYWWCEYCHCFLLVVVFQYPASRVTSIFPRWVGKEESLCRHLQVPLICRSSSDLDESDKFHTG